MNALFPFAWVGGDGSRHQENNAPVAALLRIQGPARIVHLAPILMINLERNLSSKYGIYEIISHLEGRVFLEERERSSLDFLFAHDRRALLSG